MLLIIDNFVPIEVKTRLYTQSRYDEEQEEWSMNTSNLVDMAPIRRPVSLPTRRRPTSEYALHMIKTKDTTCASNTTPTESPAIRYKGENILSYELDMPLRTTHEYKNPKVSASLQAVLAEAMQTEDEIDITDQV